MCLATQRSLNNIDDKTNLSLVVAPPKGLEGEAGLSPARSRHCNWYRISPHTARGGAETRSQETCPRPDLIHFAEKGYESPRAFARP